MAIVDQIETYNQISDFDKKYLIIIKEVIEERETSIPERFKKKVNLVLIEIKQLLRIIDADRMIGSVEFIDLSSKVDFINNIHDLSKMAEVDFFCELGFVATDLIKSWKIPESFFTSSTKYLDFIEALD